MENSYANKTHFHKKGSHLSVSRAGTGKRNFNLGWGGGGGGGAALENLKTRVGRKSRGILPQKILKFRGSEMVFSTFSMRYFSKKP